MGVGGPLHPVNPTPPNLSSAPLVRNQFDPEVSALGGCAAAGRFIAARWWLLI